MAKFDINSAYRNVPVHSDDQFLFHMKWRGEFFVDLALPFGLRSAVLAFSSIADLLEWILKHKYGLNSLLHYMDDFQTLELAYLLKQYWHLCALVWRMGYPPFTQRNWRGPLIV